MTNQEATLVATSQYLTKGFTTLTDIKYISDYKTEAYEEFTDEGLLNEIQTLIGALTAKGITNLSNLLEEDITDTVHNYLSKKQAEKFLDNYLADIIESTYSDLTYNIMERLNR